jgi:glutaredoxin
MIKIYSLPVCPNCKVLKTTLKERNITFEEEELGTPKVKTEMLMHHVFTDMAPVLRVDDKYYTSIEIFNEKGDVKVDILNTLS